MAPSTLSDRSRNFSASYKRWMLLLIMLAYAFSFMDRIIIATVGQAIKVDLALSDVQLGLLGGMAFAFFYTVLGIPVARLAEHKSRVAIISACVLIFSLMTFLCGMVQNYWQLLLCRMGVGIGEAGGTPSSHSLIADHYPVEKRASVIALFSIGVPLGAVTGAVLGGWIVSNWGWRPAFFVVGLPGLLLSGLMFLTLREPARGLSEKSDASVKDTGGHVPSMRDVLARLWSKPSFIRIVIGCSLAGFANFAVNMFMPSYFVRVFGFSYAQAGLTLGIVSGGASLIGTLGGGFLSDWAGKKDPRWYAWVPAAAFVLGTPFYLIAFSQSHWQVALPVMMFGAIFFYAWNGPTFSVTLNLVEPRMRASASAILLFAVNMIGQGLGPVFIGFASDRFAARAFTAGQYATQCAGGRPAPGATAELAQACLQASASGIQLAMLVCSCVFLGAAVFYFLAARTVRADLAPEQQERLPRTVKRPVPAR
jgi:predicted MFS family arabinose efflux permease